MSLQVDDTSSPDSTVTYSVYGSYSDGSSSPTNLDHLPLTHDPEFLQFREKTLAMYARSRRANPRMSRVVGDRQTEKHSDPAYLERRLRNNAAARRSRELRNLRMVELQIQEAYLKHTVIKLTRYLHAVNKQLDAISCSIK